jgi:hypothetical protein
MNDYSSGHYSEDEVSRIIRRALKIRQTDTVSHADLIETAGDLGIDAHTLEAAIELERRETIRRRRLTRRKVGFYWHLWSYIIVNLALVFINVLVPGPLWFQWSVLGWGIGLAFHYKALYFTRGKKYENRLQLEHERVGCLMRG